MCCSLSIQNSLGRLITFINVCYIRIQFDTMSGSNVNVLDVVSVSSHKIHMFNISTIVSKLTDYTDVS